MSMLSHWDMSTINPPDIGWQRLGNDGTGVGLVTATDIVNGIGGGHATEYDGVGERTDMGDIGEIRTLAFWVRPATTTEEIARLDTGKDIMVNGGTITYTGLTADATYVNGEPSTTLVASIWQHVVCVLDGDEDANLFALAWDGTNYGAVVLDEVMTFDAILTQLASTDLYLRSRRGML